MRNTVVVSGLVKVTSDVSPAANEDRMVQSLERTPAAEDGRRVETAGGWDPYDVWRTRVKKARDPGKQPGKTDQ